ncbi:MAG: type II secretion system protein [Candidatus Omnitrophota bacterium]
MKKGFTLVEVLVAIGILAMIAMIMFRAYPAIFEGVSISSRSMKAFEVAKKQMELLKYTNFTALSNVSYNPFNSLETPILNSFDTANFANSKGVYYVKKTLYAANSTPTADLLELEVVVCFKGGYRIIGEDRDLDGALDAGEDTNNDKRISSPVTLNTLLLKRE